jgi:hypothetical protein
MGEGALRVQAVRPGVCYGALDDILLLYYQTSPILSDLRARAGLVSDIIEAHPDGVAFLSLLDIALSEAALPDAETRAETQRQVAALEGHLVAGAMVVRGSAVTKQLTRMILSRLPVLMRGSSHMRFFSEVAPAADFCLTHLKVPKMQRKARVIQLVAAIEALREAAA